MAVTMRMDQATDIQLTIGLVTIFVITTVSVVVGCWCGKKRKQYQTDVSDEGIPNEDNGGKQEVGLRLSMLDERKCSEANNSEQKCKAVESLKDKRSNQVPPSTTTAQSSIPLTEDGYELLEPEDDMTEKKIEEYTLSLDENSGYDEVNDQEPVKAENEELPELAEENMGNDNYDYELSYWEPANKEEELMSQLYLTLKLQKIPAKNVELKEQLGSGQFGTVYRGLWRKEAKGEGNLEIFMEVAVKSLIKEASEEERVMFLKEAAIMGQFCHPYIVEILGIINDEPMRIMEELMPEGDLLHHVGSLRQKECKELAALLLSYTRQIALGMGYLHCKQYIHRDLAARNVLVSEDGVCKIADFGLSRNLQHETYYMSHGGMIPVKWTAPEALHYRKYSNSSDVWSYGCLLYEIWSLGCKPFHDLTNAQAIKKVESGYRLPPPPGCPRYIYQIMIKCWNPEPSSRPKFYDIIVKLQHPDFLIFKWADKDTANCSEKAMVLGYPIEEGVTDSLFKDLQHAYI